MKRLVLTVTFSISLLLAACDGGCDPATQPCDVDLSTRKPPVQAQDQTCDYINGQWFCK